MLESMKKEKNMELGIHFTNNRKYQGGVSYQNGYKTGIWIDLYENDYCSCKVTHQGEYSNGIKIVRWNAIFQKKILGTTDYDENGI